MESNSYIVIWNGEQIGMFVNPIPDMWYLEGKLKLFANSVAEQFRNNAQALDAKKTIKDPSKGIRVEIRSAKDEKLTHCLVYSLTEDTLFLRRFFDKDVVKWLLNNVE